MFCFNGKCYLPQPPRAWSRVQNSCSLIAPTNDTDNAFVRVPYTDQIVPYVELGPRLAMINKGNVLQYKKNSSNLTNWQKYSLIAKGQWVNRTTTWASQSTRGYTDPNTQHLQRVGGTPGTPNAYCPIIPIINNPVLPPNSGGGGGGNPPPPLPPPPPKPPVDPGTVIPLVPPPIVEPVIFPDFGNLVCGTKENLCTGEVITAIKTDNCNPTTDSDVPGPIELLCWNDGNPTWYPRQRYIMGNSTDKWPVNAVLGVAVRPAVPILSINIECSVAILSWCTDTICLPATIYNIYQNGKFLVSVDAASVTSYSIPIEKDKNYIFYIVAVTILANNIVDSYPSNEVSTMLPNIDFTYNGNAAFIHTYANGYYVLTFTNTNGYNEIESTGNISINRNINNVNYIIVGGGGGGGGNNADNDSGGGGGAGGCISVGSINIVCNTLYPIQVGCGGAGGGSVDEDGSIGGTSAFNDIGAIGGFGGKSVLSGSIGGEGLEGGSTGGNGGIYSSTIPSTNGVNSSTAFSIPYASHTYYFGGGGGGGSYTGQISSSKGGLGGGGAGGNSEGYNNFEAYYGPNGIYYPAGSVTLGSTNGLISTGGGGAGQNENGSTISAIGNGGSGIVVLWFAYP